MCLSNYISGQLFVGALARSGTSNVIYATLGLASRTTRLSWRLRWIPRRLQYVALAIQALTSNLLATCLRYACVAFWYVRVQLIVGALCRSRTLDQRTLDRIAGWASEWKWRL